MDFEHILDDLYLQLNECRLHPQESVAKFSQLKSAYQGNLFKGQIKTRQGPRALQNLVQDLSKRPPLNKRLKWSFALHMAADEQATILGEKGIFTTEGTSFNRTLPQRIKDYAIVKGRISQVYEFGSRIPGQILEELLIDDGLASRKRRNTLLDPIYNFVGIGSSYHESNEACTVIILAEDIVSLGNFIFILVAPDAAGKYKRRRGIETGKETSIKLTQQILLKDIMGKPIPYAVYPQQNLNNTARELAQSQGQSVQYSNISNPNQGQAVQYTNSNLGNSNVSNQNMGQSNLNNSQNLPNLPPPPPHIDNQPHFILDPSPAPSYQTAKPAQNLQINPAFGTLRPSTGQTVTYNNNNPNPYLNSSNTNLNSSSNLNNSGTIPNNNPPSQINPINPNPNNPSLSMSNVAGQTVSYTMNNNTNRNTNSSQPYPYQSTISNQPAPNYVNLNSPTIEQQPRNTTQSQLQQQQYQIYKNEQANNNMINTSPNLNTNTNTNTNTNANMNTNVQAPKQDKSKCSIM